MRLKTLDHYRNYHNISPSKTIILDDQHVVYIDEAHPLRGALTLPLVIDAIAYWACRHGHELEHHAGCVVSHLHGRDLGRQERAREVGHGFVARPGDVRSSE